MNFNINLYSGKYAMHCKTHEEAKSFCNYLHSINRDWANGNSYADFTYWKDYKKDTCYSFNTGSYGPYKYYQNKNNYIILEWSEFMNNNTFTKTDLKTGDIVVTKSGKKYIYINGFFVSDNGYLRIEEYNNDLSITPNVSSINDNFKIIKVQRPCDGIQYCKNYWDEAPIIWERKEVEEMTLEEICKALGKEIKIIKSK